MGCAADIVRGQITDDDIRRLACILDGSTLVFAGQVSLGILTTVLQNGLTVTRTGLGSFTVDLDELVPPDVAATVPAITIEIGASTTQRPPFIEVSQPINTTVTTFDVNIFNRNGAPSDPIWFSIVVHKSQVLAMGCASDLVRGEITDEAIRALACLVDQSTFMFAGTVSDDVLTVVFQKGMTVNRISAGVFTILLDRLVLPSDISTFGIPAVTAEVSADVTQGPPFISVDTPINLATTALVVQISNNVNTPVDPKWFSVVAHA